MPAWLIAIALKYVLPTVLSMLAKYGHDKAVQLLAGKTATQIVSEAKTYDEYPAEDSKGQTNVRNS